MQKITPHLWFDNQAKEAAVFYTSTFANSKSIGEAILHDTPNGDSAVINFEIMGMDFIAINGGPLFKFNPSISFMVNFDPSQDPNAKENIDVVWNKLLDGGKVLMGIGEYPFSKRYGWIQDKYGLSWQLILTDPQGEERPQIIPSLLFVGDSYGKAEDAVNFYLSVFKDSKSSGVMKYGPGQEPNKEGTVMFADMKLLDMWIALMDGGGEHDFAFNESVSFMVNCNDQEEIDYYWQKLSAVPESEQCGWLKDKFGISWQIIPSNMSEILNDPNPEKAKNAMQAMLQMKKIDIAKLKEARDK